ncbi:hypothetical protein [Mycobacterium sp.]|uniref:hypothetical protein n=1 Tax=Mycobacterium sp. TaxID=1785 RepID=UPI0025F1A2CE|nr:hypothetical protein [Mycobacterium sp.]
MCADGEGESVKVSDDDLDRVRELRAVARNALVEANALLAKYAGVDPDSIDSVLVSLKREASPEFGDGVPPVYVDPCTQYNSGGACAYFECDPPGVTKPCPPVTLKP